MPYNPNQPRVPAGSETGGQWTARGAAGLSGRNEAEATLFAHMESIDKLTGGRSVESFVLRHGQFYNPKPRPENVEKSENKACYMNAFNLAYNPEYDYVEGFAYPDFMDLPLQHAWVVDSKGYVIDNTWKKQGRAYFGVKISQKDLHYIILSSGVYGALDYTNEAFRNYAKELDDEL